MEEKVAKATVEQIEREIRCFVGSTGGGQWSYQISCKICRDLGTISGKNHNRKSSQNIRKAAEKFAEQGWRYSEPELICPHCYKIK